MAAAAGALDTAFSASDAMAGHDAAGLAFGLSYTRDGQALLSAAEAAVNACRNIGFGISMSATNYSRAEAASTTGGGESALPAPAKPASFTGPTMPSPMGPGVAEPMLWGLVETFVGDFWPDGEPGELRGAASAWRAFGTAISASAGDLGPASAGIAGQDIPEGAAMTSAVNAINANLTALAAQCNATAGQLESFADEVEATQDAIRDLLHRLSLSGIVEALGSIFTGHNPWDDIKEVAEDIKAVLGNMKRQADGAEAIFQQGISALDSSINSAEEWTRKEFVHYLGEDVGNAAATTVNGLVDLQYGAINSAVDAVHGIEQLDPTRFIYDSEGATKAWAGAADTAALAVPPLLAAKLAQDPDQVLDQVKGIVSYDEWNSDHPLRGLGHNIGDIAQLGIPGGAAAKPAVVAAEAEARAAAASAGAETRAASGALRDAASGATRAAGSDIAVQGSKIADDLDAVKLPESAPPPSAGPGASVTPDVKPPVDAPPPRVEPQAASDASAPRTPEHTPAVPDAAPPPRTPEATATSVGADGPAPHPPEIAPANVPESIPAHANAPASVGAETSVGPAASVPHTPADYTPPSSPNAPHPSIDSSSGSGGPAAGPHPSAPEHAPSGPRDSPPPHHGGSGEHSPGNGDHPASAGSSDDIQNHAPDHAGDASPTAPDFNGLSADKSDEIVQMEKGTRPDPAEYLPQEYIDHHLDKFSDGATRFMPESNLEKYGIAQRDGTSFVMPKSEADAMIEATRGDPRAMERALGLPEGFLDSNGVVRIDIAHPDEFNLRIPSGNEAGANDQWIPGGQLPDGASEAVINGGDIPPGGYTVDNFSE